MSDVRATVDAILKGVLNCNKTIAPAKLLVDDLGLDSLKMMELTAAMEDTFDVIIPISRVAQIKTVADLYRAAANLGDYTLTAATEQPA